jgi:phage I-like protein
MTGKLEAAGELPKGTYEAARKQLDESELGKKDTNKPDELEQKISTLPEVQFARELMRKTQEEQATENLKLEKTLQDFEARHKDIPNSEKPSVIRKRIATLADGYVEEGMKYEDALEEAYNMLFNKDAVLAREREKGEVEGQIKAGIKSVTGTTVGSSSSNPQTLRKLTREEEEARALLGMSKEEYIKYKDSDGFVE